MNRQITRQAAQPLLNTAQFDAGATGEINNSVNLFRGELNFPYPLVSLPGRNGLDAVVNAHYSSAVHSQVSIWNMQANVGVLGVGWNLPIDRIVVAGQRSGANEDDDFYLAAGGQVIQLFRTKEKQGVIFFEQKTSPFWEIKYEKKHERWTITKEDGVKQLYGGEANGIQYGIKWNNWTGSSTQSGAQRYPLAWNLVKVEDYFGDQIHLEYESTEVAIGRSGLSYAQSTRIKTITDTFGQKIVFHYQKREPFEIQFPHLPPRPGDGHAFQFQFEDRYLDTVEIINENAQPLFTLKFDYRFMTLGDDARGDDHYKKRYLTAIQKSLPNGEAEPPMLFSYYDSNEDVQAGALKDITYPQGGRASYLFEQAEMPQSNAQAEIKSPGVGFVPRVWHGLNYTVVTWYHRERLELVFNVYSWTGVWDSWSLKRVDELQLADLVVIPADGFFAVYYKEAQSRVYKLFLYKESPYRYGEWQEHEVQLGDRYSDIVVAVGKDFVAAHDSSGRQLNLVQWNGLTKAWQQTDFDSDAAERVVLGAQGNACIAAFYQRGALKLQLYYSDANLRWHRGGTKVLPTEIDWEFTDRNAFWQMAPSFATATFATGHDQRELHYAMAIVQWRADFSIERLDLHKHSQSRALDNPVLFSPINQAVVGNGQHLYRYDGQNWERKDLLTPQADTQYRYSYGDDIVIAAQRRSGKDSYTSLVYDPYQLSWAQGPVSGGAGSAASIALPTCSGDYCTAGTTVYHRDSRYAWKLIHRLPGTIALQTLQNRAPNYLAYELNDQRVTVVEFFKDGKACGDVTLHGERIYAGAYEPGKLLAGAYAFVTYKHHDFDSAPALYLYRPVDHALQRYQRARYVSKLEIDTGLSKITNTYKYDVDTCRYDPFNHLVQFVKAYTYRGDSDDAAGHSEHVFFNGLNPNVADVEYPDNGKFTNAKDYFSYLNGYLYRKLDYNADGQCVAEQVNDYYVRDSVDRQGLIGAYIRQRRVTHSLRLQRLDQQWQAAPAEFVSVSRASESEYNDKGQLQRVITMYFNSLGEKATVSEETRYAWEVYPQLADLRLLSYPAEKTTRNLSKDLITAIEVTTYKNTWNDGAYALWAPHKQYAWEGVAGTERFDFSAWSDTGEPAAGWLKQRETLALTRYGQTIETTDVDGIHDATLYDRDDRSVVATFTNTSLIGREGSYYGFESYESPQGWELIAAPAGPSAAIIDSDAYSGDNSLKLPGNVQHKTGLRTRITAPRQGQKILLGCRMKTPADYPLTAALPGWEIESAGQSRFVPLPSTQGRWAYFHTVIDPQALYAHADVAISLFVYNQTGATEILIDDVNVVPLHGGFNAEVLEPHYRLTTAALDHVGRCDFYAYDRYQRGSLETSSERPRALTCNFNWREFTDVFDRKDPNAAVSINARTGGCFDDFHHGDEWRANWAPEGAWAIADHTLRHTGTGVGTLGLNPRWQHGNYGLALAFSFPKPVAKPMGIAVNDQLRIVWAGGQWQLEDGGSQREDSVRNDTLQPARDWLLLVAGEKLLFYGDGELIFSRQYDADIGGLPQLFVEDPVTVRHIGFATDIIAGTSYTDNAGNEWQSQQLTDDGVSVSGTVYDDLNRDAVQTKAMYWPSGLFGYRADFVESIDWQSGIMTGELARYYPDDQGYPYTRKRFERSPLNRVAETGLPGEAFAINLRREPDDRHTAQKLYATNAELEFLPELPHNQYFVERQLDPDKNPQVSVKDTADNVVAVVHGQLDERSQGYAITRNVYDDYGNLAEVQWPNYFATEVEAPENFKDVMTYDFLGRMTSKQTPNSPTPYRYVYDKAGRVRFMLDPSGQAEGYILYWRYDRLGRSVEQGYCDCPWDQALLTRHAHERDWLPAAGHWEKRFYYDGDGSDLFQLGQLVGTEVAHPGGDSASVIERLRYDREGNVREKTVKVAAFDAAGEYTTSYDHDLAGNTVKVNYDATNPSPPVAVGYRFDQRGSPRAVEAYIDGARQAQTIATFAYSANGEVCVESLHAGAAPISRRYQYNSPGWLKKISDAYFTEELDYTEGGYQGAQYYNGWIARSRQRFADSVGDDCFVRDYEYRYGYNRLGRLQVAENSVDPAWSIGVQQPTAYDPNNNILHLQRGAQTAHYDYQPGTDKVLDVAGADSGAYHYDANGNIRSAGPKGIENIAYSRCGAKAVAVEQGFAARGEGHRFEYDGSDRRVLKRAWDHDKLYLLSASGNPLVELVRDEAGEVTPTYLIHGPTGLLALIKSGERYLLLKDHLSSTRAIVHDDGAIAAYNYRPFGEFMGAPHESHAGLCDYLYTGQELDRTLDLYNFKARFYDPGLCRFYSVDPAAQFPSPYVYVGNNPVSMVDPTGEIGILALLAIGIIGGALIEGASYAVSTKINKEEFDWNKFGVALGIGAATGLVGVGYGAAASKLTLSVGVQAGRLAHFGARALEGTVHGAIGGVLTSGTHQLLNTAADKERWDEGLGRAVGNGALVGSVFGFLGGYSKYHGEVRRSYVDTARGIPSRPEVLNGELLQRERARQAFNLRKDAFDAARNRTDPVVMRNVLKARDYCSKPRPTFEGLLERKGDQGIIDSSARPSQFWTAAAPERNYGVWLSGWGWGGWKKNWV